MEVLNYFENKEHKEHKYNEIIQIKSSMNDRRTVSLKSSKKFL
jgi:hypothetical protein